MAGYTREKMPGSDKLSFGGGSPAKAVQPHEAPRATPTIKREIVIDGVSQREKSLMQVLVGSLEPSTQIVDEHSILGEEAASIGLKNSPFGDGTALNLVRSEILALPNRLIDPKDARLRGRLTPTQVHDPSIPSGITQAELEVLFAERIGGAISVNKSNSVIISIGERQLRNVVRFILKSCLSAQKDDPFIKDLRAGHVDVDGLRDTIEQATGWKLPRLKNQQEERSLVSGREALPSPQEEELDNANAEEIIDQVEIAVRSRRETDQREKRKQISLTKAILGGLVFAAAVATCTLGVARISNAPGKEGIGAPQWGQLGAESTPGAFSTPYALPTPTEGLTLSNESVSSLTVILPAIGEIKPTTPFITSSTNISQTQNPAPMLNPKTSESGICLAAFPNGTIVKGNETLYQTARNIQTQAKAKLTGDESCRIIADYSLNKLVSALVSENGIATPNNVFNGTVLKIPNLK